MKRKAVGIWGCKDCGKVKAGGAYTMKYVLSSYFDLGIGTHYWTFFSSCNKPYIVANVIILLFVFAALLVQSLSGAQSVA